MSTQIRECKIDDFNYIYELNQVEMGYDYSIEETKRKLHKLLVSKADKIYVAIVENKVVGYVHTNDYDVIYAPHMKNIMGIAVSADYKRRGIGHSLLEEVEKWAIHTGAKGVRLVSGETRTGAHEFYRNCGYSEDKMQINFKKFF